MTDTNKAPAAKFSYSIKSESGYSSSQKGTISPERHGVVCAALDGMLTDDQELLKAAPDLLEALEALVEYVDEMHRIGHIQRPVQSSNAIAAIAKARGGK